MALIPPDAGIRMRMQTEANLLQPVHPAHEISSDLPDLRPGQNFNARIQEVLPDNSYRALVAGKQLTLQLPEGAKAGDELNLTVVDRSGRVIIAKQVEGQATTQAGDTGPYPFAKFSPAARMIGQLLPAEGEPAPPLQLNRGQPLLPNPPQPQNAAVLLAPTLAKAVTQSGMFYEAHQAQWVTGKLPLEQLLQEPQGQRSQPAAFQHAAAEIAARAISTSERPVTTNTVLQALQGAAPEKVGAGGTAPQAPNPPPAAQPALLAQQVPDDLRPLVQQQLDAAATQRMAWHGEVWPRQTMDWEIGRDLERDGDGSGDEEYRWNTTLALTTPRLGRIDAALRLTTEGVRIAIATPYGASAADLRDAAPKLASALEAAGVPLLGFVVKHAEEPTEGGTP
mgnify:CR=1 FL=1